MKQFSIDCKLQFFGGFYESLWYYCDSLYEYEREEEVTDDDYTFDFAAYKKNVCEHVTECYQEWCDDIFGDGIIKVEFQGITSPREYNYYTDSCDVNIKFDENGKSIILQKFLDNWDVISEWIIKNHKSYDGFWSYLDNEPEKWKDAPFDDKEWHQPAYISCLLDYIIKAEWKKRGWDTNLDMGADEASEVYLESYCTITNQELLDKREEESKQRQLWESSPLLELNGVRL